MKERRQRQANCVPRVAENIGDRGVGRAMVGNPLRKCEITAQGAETPDSISESEFSVASE